MRPTPVQMAAIACAALLAAAGTWWWLVSMEQRWETQVEVSAAARENPMLAATRLLLRYHYAVSTKDGLGQALLKALPHGTMIIADNTGVMTQQQANQLLAWVTQGNTLIMIPKWTGPIVMARPPLPPNAGVPGVVPQPMRPLLNFSDPLAEQFGVTQVLSFPKGVICKRDLGKPVPDERSLPDKLTVTQCVGSIVLPGADHALRMDSGGVRLGDGGPVRPMLLSDRDAQTVRAFAVRSGRLVFVAHNYFTNDALPAYDHAELLLGLAGLANGNRDAPNVIIVQKLDILPWHGMLWARMPLAIVSLGAVLLLLLWAAVVRFGPLLPEPDRERRALLEHIDASARWLWKTQVGRDMLLKAVRGATEKLLARRVPQLRALPAEERIRHLGEQCRIAQSQLTAALQLPASAVPAEFTSQIQTLQRLRKHYER